MLPFRALTAWARLNGHAPAAALAAVSTSGAVGKNAS
jgi:hypothetical protein